jgi:hypothetical protein
VKTYSLGTLAGLRLSATPLALLGSLVLLVVLSGIAVGVLGVPIGLALVGGMLAVGLHWAAVLVHQFGHAWAARGTGYPMLGTQLGTLGLLGSSVYPTNEPPLPGSVHIRRALGGPIGNLVFTIIAVMVAFGLNVLDRGLGWVGVFFVLDNLLVFGLGSFVPMGFTDGSTILQWWDRRFEQ